MVDGLDLANLDEPHLDVLGCGGQHPLPVIVGLADDRVEVFQTLHDADGHLATVAGHVRARVKGCSEAFADLFHPDL